MAGPLAGALTATVAAAIGAAVGSVLTFLIPRWWRRRTEKSVPLDVEPSELTAWRAMIPHEIQADSLVKKQYRGKTVEWTGRVTRVQAFPKPQATLHTDSHFDVWCPMTVASAISEGMTIRVRGKIFSISASRVMIEARDVTVVPPSE
jgi:hypothetical protein